MVRLEDVLRFVPFTPLKAVTPLLLEANYYETRMKYTPEELQQHFTAKYITKEPWIPKSRYNIEVKD